MAANHHCSATNTRPVALTLSAPVLVGLISLLSVIPYIRDVGIYADDWYFLSKMYGSPDQSFLGLWKVLSDPNTLPRPIQILFTVVTYQMFGINPLGFQLVNALFMALGGVAFYLVLERIGLPQPVTLPAALVFTLLPHASANRFWYSLFFANISTLFYFLSLYADLRGIEECRARRWVWSALGLLSLLISVLTYEVLIPFFLLNLLLVGYRYRQLRRQHQPVATIRAVTVSLALNIVVLLPALVFKAIATDRLPQGATFLEKAAFFVSLLRDAIVALLVGPYGIRLPRTVQYALHAPMGPLVVPLSLLVGLLIFGYLYRAKTTIDAGWSARWAMAKLLGLSLLLFLAGFAIFLPTQQAMITTTGTGNRSFLAAVIGIALIAVAGISLVISFLPQQLAYIGFASLVALYCASGFFLNAAIGAYWIAAAEQQKVVLLEVRSHFPTLERESIIVLDGQCPYIGPGIVFEWVEFGNALQILYKDPTLQGDVVNKRIEVRPDGLYTRIYSAHIRIRPYAKLWIYNAQTQTAYRIPDADAARRYFKAFDPANTCRHSGAGRGIQIW